MNKLLLPLLVASLLLSGCKDAPSKNNRSAGTSSNDSVKGIVHEIGPPPQNRGFKIDAPHNWTKADTVFFGTKITFIKSPEEEGDHFIENVNVIAEKTGGASLGEYVEKSLVAMRSQLNDFKEGHRMDKTINGIDFNNLKYSHIYNGRTLDVDVYFAINGQSGYVITCTTVHGDLPKWQPVFDEIIQSFSFE